MSTISIPGGAGSKIGTIQTATLTLTNTQINALSDSATQILVPAPSSTQIIIPITFSASLNYSTTFSGGKRLKIRTNTADIGVYNELWNTSIIDTPQTENRFASGSMGWVGNYRATSNYTAKSIRIAGSGTPYTGGTGSTITFTCLYYVLDL
jgi:hypothetical protein